jgi:hypothetical protein
LEEKEFSFKKTFEWHMKKVLLLLFIAFSFRGFSQSISYPTVREIYDFAVGDSFEYALGICQPGGGTFEYQYTILLNRVDYANDSIIYLVKEIRSWPGINPFTYQLKIERLDSAFYYHELSNWTVDSIWVKAIGGDTAYHANAHSFDSQYYCDWTQTYGGHTTASRSYGIGLGTIYSTTEYNSMCYDCYFKHLIYAHKSNGFTYGTANNSHFVGIEDIAKKNLVLSPNPATAALTIQREYAFPPQTSFQLFDLSGRMVLQQELRGKSNRIELNEVSRGMYVYSVITEREKVGAGKLVVE